MARNIGKGKAFNDNEMKLCIVYNFAQHYRAGIFKLISEAYDCDFYFGNSMGDVKKLDYSLLQGKVTEMHISRRYGLSYQKGVVRLLRKPYTTYLMLGDTRSVSMWIFLLLSKFYPKKKVYLWSHGWYGKESGLERWMKRLFFRLPSGGVFLYGNYARALMVKDGFNPDKLFTIHNSLDYEHQVEVREQLSPTDVYKEHFGNANPNLFFVGRLTPVKKLDMVLRAMAQLLERGQEYNMTFIGDGTVRESLEALTRELGLEKNVWFYGACYDEKVLGELIYNADLCVAPGNIGLTAMHTLVFGTPALTHDDFPHQMPEFEAIREDETGSFFKNDNVESMAESISRWFAEKGGQRESVRQACMNEIDTSWTPQFQLKVLQSVIHE